MSKTVIPKAAVEAAERVLLGYTGGCVCDESYTGRNLEDPDCLYHAVPPEAVNLILEAAAPHMAKVISERVGKRYAHIYELTRDELRVQAWAQGAQAGFDSTAEGFNGECAFDHCSPDHYPPTNPYSGEPWEVTGWVEPA